MLRITIFNEYVHERRDPEVARVYPTGIHSALEQGIRKHLGRELEIRVHTATLEEAENGLPAEVLAQTDVLLWWGHQAHDQVLDRVVDSVQQQVLAGMGLIVLHSGHYSKIFKRLMGTNCSLRWRESDDKERLWNLQPSHPILKGIPAYIELAAEEMYGEQFDIPTPDELLMISWFSGGEVFRSLCTWQRGNGKVVYFRPGHETYPTYHDDNIMKIISNASRWAGRTITAPTDNAPMTEPPEPRRP